MTAAVAKRDAMKSSERGCLADKGGLDSDAESPRRTNCGNASQFIGRKKTTEFSNETRALYAGGGGV